MLAAEDPRGTKTAISPGRSYTAGRWATPLILLALLVQACGGSPETTAAPADGAQTAVTVAGDAPPPPPESSEPAPSTASTVSATTSLPQRDAAAQPAASGPAAPAASGSDDPVVTGPAPTAVGTYHYLQEGSTTAGGSTKEVPPTGTLKVEPATADRVQMHHRSISGDSSSHIRYGFTPEGAEIRSIRTRTSAAGGTFDYECRFDPPLPSPPWPTEVGQTFAASATCGSFELEVTGVVRAAEIAEVESQQVPVFVIESSFTTTGQLESSGTQVDWYSADHRLVVRQESRQQGTFGLIPFESHVVSQLESLTPR